MAEVSTRRQATATVKTQRHAARKRQRAKMPLRRRFKHDAEIEWQFVLLAISTARRRAATAMTPAS